MITPEQLWRTARSTDIVPEEQQHKQWTDLTPHQREQWALMAVAVNNHFVMVATFRKQTL